MGYFLRWITRHGNRVTWVVALAVAGGVYAGLNSGEEIQLFGSGAPHVVEWWEPPVWSVVCFILVLRIGRGLTARVVSRAARLNRFLGNRR